MNEDAKTRIEKMLREAGPILKKLDQPVVVPPQVLARLRAAKEKKFPTWTELTAKEMEPLLLSVLAKGQMDGFDIISKLEKAHIRIKGAGEAVNYGVLSKLVSAGHVQVDLEDRGGQMRKFYRLTEDGRGLLKKAEAPELQTLVASVLAAG
jgi:DNA-binding PadR family transcriptional regulator